MGSPLASEGADRDRWWRRWSWSSVGSLVALAAASIALVFTIWPGLRPDPRDRLKADAAVVSIDRRVTLDQWLRRTTFSPQDYNAQRLRQLEVTGEPPEAAAGLLRSSGQVAYVASTVEGFKRRSVRLRWSLYAADTGVRLPQFSNVGAARLDLGAPSDRTIQEIWLPPLQPGRYVMRVALYSGDDTLLDVSDSKPFSAP